MELIYTTRTDGFEADKHYRNPIYFEAVEPNVSAVLLDGDYPDVALAYQSLGITVNLLAPVITDLTQLNVAELKAMLTELNIDFPSNAKKEALITLLEQTQGDQNEPEHTE